MTTQLAEVEPDRLDRELRTRGICLASGPFVAKVRAQTPLIARGLHLLYPDHPLLPATGFADFHIAITRPVGPRRWIRPQVNFSFDGVVPFKPLPLEQAFAVFEWGLNWCISNHSNQYLILHAAVVAREGRALLIPGSPGAGKSTLCAGLVAHGWRLLSDELALVDPQTLEVQALPRPISLKNRSIEVVQRFAPGQTFGPPIHDTTKGTVAHLRPDRESVLRGDEPALPSWIVFPRFTPGRPTTTRSRTKARAFMGLAQQSFNYSILGRSGFSATQRLIDRCACHDLQHADLASGLVALEALTDATAGEGQDRGLGILDPRSAPIGSEPATTPRPS